MNELRFMIDESVLIKCKKVAHSGQIISCFSIMQVALVGILFAILFLKANCENDNEMKAKIDALEKRLAKIDVVEKRVAALEQQQGETMSKQSFFKRSYLKDKVYIYIYTHL